MEYTLLRWIRLARPRPGQPLDPHWAVYYTKPGDLMQRVVFVDARNMSDELARQSIELDIANASPSPRD